MDIYDYVEEYLDTGIVPSKLFGGLDLVSFAEKKSIELGNKDDLTEREEELLEMFTNVSMTKRQNCPLPGNPFVAREEISLTIKPRKKSVKPLSTEKEKTLQLLSVEMKEFLNGSTPSRGFFQRVYKNTSEGELPYLAEEVWARRDLIAKDIMKSTRSKSEAVERIKKDLSISERAASNLFKKLLQR